MKSPLPAWFYYLLINAGILDGDYLLVRQQNNASNGDVVVALVDSEEGNRKTIL